jgi:hypothetical protein
MTRQSILMILIMTLLMGVILSAVFTFQDIGLSVEFLPQWIRRFLSTYILVLPTVLIVAPVAQRLATSIDRHLPQTKTNQAE